MSVHSLHAEGCDGRRSCIRLWGESMNIFALVDDLRLFQEQVTPQPLRSR